MGRGETPSSGDPRCRAESGKRGDNIRKLRLLLKVLGKLVRLLASPVDREVIGAARFLDRGLANNGGFHHLASVIEEHWPPPPAEPKPEWSQTLAARLLEHPEILLGSRERDFLRNIHCSPVPPTNRQVKWLNDIAARPSPQRMAS
jgi:hypothetical protein